jgi:hypothetical protein
MARRDLRNSPLTGEHEAPIYRGVVRRKGLGRLVLPFILMLGVAHAQPGKVTYVYTDPQGTPLAEADAKGTSKNHPIPGSVAPSPGPPRVRR